MRMTYKLEKSTRFEKPKGPVLLIIMDGIGLGKAEPGNAVYNAHTPTLDRLMTLPLYTSLKAHGTAVGMPSDDDMGNSEVGHNALGAGRIFDQGATRVQNAIKSDELFRGDTWNHLIKNVHTKNSALHFIGLLSDGNVHAHINHLLSMLTNAAKNGIKKSRVHILLDGRDVAQKSALLYIEKLENHLAELHKHYNTDYRIASGGGRMVVTMDRYNADWEMVKRGWHAHVLGEADRTFSSAKEAVETFYQEDTHRFDQYLPPFVITENAQAIGTIQDHDSVIFFNFRGDRAIELSLAFEAKEFTHFDRKRVPACVFAGMMQYDGDIQCPHHFLVSPTAIDGSVSQYLCEAGIRSFAISETQKFGHVTYFWNGNKSGYINKNLETYIEIPSINIPFDQKPAMRAFEITEKTIELLNSGNYDFGRVNFPNGDMVGHSGNFQAAVEAVEVTDQCVQKLLDAILALDGIAIVLADHGNADEMFTEKNGVRLVKTAHTLNPVPCAIVGNQLQVQLAHPSHAGLANIAATICNLLGYEAPKDYEPSLIKA